MRFFWDWGPCTSGSLLQSVKKLNMKETTPNSFSKSIWRNVCAIAIACCWSLAASVEAQQADAGNDANQQTNKAAVQVEDSTTQPTSGSNEWWDSDTDWEGKEVR